MSSVDIPFAIVKRFDVNRKKVKIPPIKQLKILPINLHLVIDNS